MGDVWAVQLEPLFAVPKITPERATVKQIAVVGQLIPVKSSQPVGAPYF
jgi:hypothetical protein